MNKQYIIRLDDACERMNIKNWKRMEKLLDKYEIRPLVGVIPNCEDPEMMKYDIDPSFWNTVNDWVNKKWIIAMHGFNHKFVTQSGGINPVNNRSEFAGVDLNEQKEKIRKAKDIFLSHGIHPIVFFAPAHTFDNNTLIALKEESSIRIISDTIANKSYCENGFTFVPQQCGVVRKTMFTTTTFCYHPNNMVDKDYELLEQFLIKHKKLFVDFPLTQTNRKKSCFDKLLMKLYFLRRKFKKGAR